jgi:energy-coupling factor transport system permease protein
VGRGAFARRLLAGSLDRSVDVAATLELRGYGISVAGRSRERARSRHDRRFWVAAVALSAVALAGRLAGAGDFEAYPQVELAMDGMTLAVAATAVLAGLVPLRRRQARRALIAMPEAARA